MQIIDFNAIAEESGLLEQPTDTKWWLDRCKLSIELALQGARQTKTYRDEGGYMAAFIANLEGQYAQDLNNELRTIKSLKQLETATQKSLDLIKGLDSVVTKLAA